MWSINTIGCVIVCVQLVRLGAVIFSGFVCLGQVIFAMGANINSYAVMLAGRFVFGLVCVCVCVCVCACVHVCVCVYIIMCVCVCLSVLVVNKGHIFGPYLKLSLGLEERTLQWHRMHTLSLGSRRKKSIWCLVYCSASLDW